MAIMPWFLLASRRFLKNRHFKDMIKAVGLFILLLFTHEIAIIFLAIYVGIFVSYKLIQHIIGKMMYLGMKTRRTSIFLGWYERHKSTRVLLLWIAFAVMLAGSFIMGLVVLAPIINPNLSIEFFLDGSIEIAKYFGIRLGVMIFLLPVGVLATFHRDINDQRKLIHFIVLPLILFVISTQVYTLIIFFPVFGYYSVRGFEAVKKAIPRGWVGLGLLMMVFTFGLAYFSLGYDLVLALGPFLIGFFSLLTVGWLYRNHILLRTSTKSSKRYGILILISSMIIFSLMFSDSVASSTMTFSDDEKSIIEYIQEQPDPGISFVYSHRVGRRLEAYGIPAVMSFNDDVSLYYGWIDRNMILSGTQLDFGLLLRNGKLFRFDGQSPEWALWSSLVNLNLADVNQYILAKEIGLEYVIVEKNSIGYSDTLLLKDGVIVSPCNILATAPLSCELVLDGSTMSLFKLT